jgi:hypothetical protein
LWADADAAAEAKLSGVNASRFKLMVEEAQDGPTIEQTLEGLRRGKLTPARLTRALDQAGVRSEWRPFLAELAERLFTVEQLANMVIRGVISQAEGTSRAALVGYPPSDFDLMVRVTGNPPGNEEILDLWNRGQINEDDVNRGLAQSNLKPEWFEDFKVRRFFIPTVADLVRFAVREVFTPAIRASYGLDDGFPAEFETQGVKRGLSPEWARAYWAAHWELPSVEQAFRMLHRGEISLPELETLLRTKDVMPYWRQKLTNIAYLVPGRVDLRRMFRAGVLDETQVLAGYTRLGYHPDDAATLTSFAVTEKLNASSGGDLLSRFRRSVIVRAHREYLEHSIDEAAARQILADLTIRQTTVDQIMPLWTIERDLFRRELTPAQLRSAYKKAGLPLAEAMQRLDDAGYTLDDAKYFLES